jgi:hypothetical protein
MSIKPNKSPHGEAPSTRRPMLTRSSFSRGSLSKPFTTWSSIVAEHSVTDTLRIDMTNLSDLVLKVAAVIHPGFATHTSSSPLLSAATASSRFSASPWIFRVIHQYISHEVRVFSILTLINRYSGIKAGRLVGSRGTALPLM